MVEVSNNHPRNLYPATCWSCQYQRARRLSQKVGRLRSDINSGYIGMIKPQRAQRTQRKRRVRCIIPMSTDLIWWESSNMGLLIMLDSAQYVILATPKNPPSRLASLWTQSRGLHSSEGAIALSHLLFPILTWTLSKFSQAQPSVREKNRQDACSTKIFLLLWNGPESPFNIFWKTHN